MWRAPTALCAPRAQFKPSGLLNAAVQRSPFWICNAAMVKKSLRGIWSISGMFPSGAYCWTCGKLFIRATPLGQQHHSACFRGECKGRKKHLPHLRLTQKYAAPKELLMCCMTDDKRQWSSRLRLRLLREVTTSCLFVIPVGWSLFFGGEFWIT